MFFWEGLVAVAIDEGYIDRDQAEDSRNLDTNDDA